MIRVACDGCGRKYRVKNSRGGRVVRCPGCGTGIPIPPVEPTEPMPSLSATTAALQDPADSTFISRDDLPHPADRLDA